MGESGAQGMKRRDRAATERAILDAGREVLSEQGFQHFGVNSVAKQAGCDKQLIYRYFGGLEGLAAAIGTDLAGWIGNSMPAIPVTVSYGRRVVLLLSAFAEALAANRLIQRIAAWELVEDSLMVKALARARSDALGQWIASVFGDGPAAPPGVDAPAINAVLIAAVQHLVLSQATTGGFAGVDLSDDSGNARIDEAINRLVAGVYGF